MIKPIVIVGAGPAGLMAAVAAAGKGHPVEIVEYLAAPGRKLLASGGGKCNLTNILPVEEMIRRFPREQQRFITPALRAFPPQKLLAFFADRGVRCSLASDGFHYFPASERARDVLNGLLDELRAHAIPIHSGYQVESFGCENNHISSVIAGGRRIDCSAVIVAAGGPGYPALGGMRSIERVLRDVGVPICEVLPALAGLQCREAWCENFSGQVFADAEAWIEGVPHQYGDVIFTHRGVSGPAVQDLSGYASRLLGEKKELTLRLNLRGCDSAEIWRTRLRDFRRNQGGRELKALLAPYFTRAWAEFICAQAEADIAGRLTASAEKRLLELLTALPLTVHAPETWERSMASTGGVARDAVDPRTLRSRVLDNCYFAGEVLDVDGPCGGFNIQWAFSSGFLAGSAATRRTAENP